MHVTPFSASVSQRGTCLCITLAGELDIQHADALDVELDRSGPCDLVVVDTTALTFIDSTGIHALLRARATTERAGSRFVVVCDDGPVRRTLDLAGVVGVLSIAMHHPRPSLRPAA